MSEGRHAGWQADRQTRTLSSSLQKVMIQSFPRSFRSSSLILIVVVAPATSDPATAADDGGAVGTTGVAARVVTWGLVRVRLRAFPVVAAAGAPHAEVAADRLLLLLLLPPPLRAHKSTACAASSVSPVSLRISDGCMPVRSATVSKPAFNSAAREASLKGSARISMDVFLVLARTTALVSVANLVAAAACHWLLHCKDKIGLSPFS